MQADGQIWSEWHAGPVIWPVWLLIRSIQVLFLCKNNKYKGIVDLNTIYQQFKTAVVLKNSDAIELFENILLQWIDMDDVETLKLCADLGSAALAKEDNSGE